MNLIFHQFKKDIRHFRLLLIIWLFLIVFQSGISMLDIQPVHITAQPRMEKFGARPARIMYEYKEEIHLASRIISIITFFIQPLVLIVLIFFIVYDEPLVGSTAFWFTRPISRKTLLASKSLFVLLFLVLIPFITQICVLIYHGTSINHILLAIPGMLIVEFAVTILIFLLASLTHQFTNFLLIVSNAFVLYAITYIASLVFKRFIDISLQPPGQNGAMLMCIMFGAGLIIHQYLTRRTIRTVLIMVLAILSIVSVAYLWQWEALERSFVLPFSFNPSLKIKANLEAHLAEAYTDRGIRYDETQYDQILKAIEDYNKAIEIEPRYARAYYDRGWTYKKLGQIYTAVGDFTRAIELNPQYTRAYYIRGNTYDDLGEYQKAIEDFTKAIEIDPKHSWAYNNRGGNYEDLGQLDKAIKDYDKAIELDPKNAIAYYNRATYYFNSGENEKATADFERLTTLEPGNAYEYLHRGWAYYRLAYHGGKHHNKRELHDALYNYNRAIELDPKLSSAYYNRALVYHDYWIFDRAIADYSKAIELDPDCELYYYYRGKAYKQSGQTMKMVEDFDKVVEMNPKETHRLAHAMIELAMVAYEKGYYDQVKNLCNSMVEKCPLDETASKLPYEFRYVNDAEFLLGEILKSEGNTEEAMKHYNRIQRITKEYDTVPVYANNKWTDVPVEQILKERIQK